MSSDEEVLGFSEPEDEDDWEDENEGEDEENYEDDIQESGAKSKRGFVDAASSESSDEEERKEEDYSGWGSSKKDYYDADVIETEADALEEEAEAKKLQQKHLESIKEDDFGLDETDWLIGRQGADGETKGGVEDVTEVLPELQITSDMGEEERNRIFKQRYPEFEPLAMDFSSLQKLHEAMGEVAKKVRMRQMKKGENLNDLPVAVIKFLALSGYLGAISMYFFLLTSSARGGEKKPPMPPLQLREHPIMETLLACRKQWEETRALEGPEAGAEVEPKTMTKKHKKLKNKKDIAEDKSRKQKNEKKSRQDNQPDSTFIMDVDDSKPKSKKAAKAEAARVRAEDSRAETLRKAEADLASLDTLLTYKDARKPSKPPVDYDSDYGDEPVPTGADLAAKLAKKKSLRFYSAQADQKAVRRGAATRDAGGDTDIPYRERLKDRQARLLEQAQKRGRQAPDDLAAQAREEDSSSGDEEEQRIAREVRGEDVDGHHAAKGKVKNQHGEAKSQAASAPSNSDNYYDLVVARAAAKRSDKQSRATAAAAAHAEARATAGAVEMEQTIGPDGKRAISYAIAKNKGLTPRRSKDVRNPRVKKRKKFDEKRKKLGSMRPVWRGGEGRGGYGGELTGIKTNVVKSTKL